MISDATVAAVALAEEAGIEPRLFALLVLHFGPPEAILDLLPEELRSLAQVSAGHAESIRRAGEDLPAVRARLEALATRAIRPVTVFDPEYPDALRPIAEPPPVLYLRGALPSSGRSLAVLGGPDADAAAIADAVALGKQLAALDWGVVSGLDAGIAAGVHLGALAAGGAPLAVPASGLEQLDSPEQDILAGQIAVTGGLLSPHAPGARSTRARAATSDRVVSALGEALVVVAPEGDADRLGRLTEATLHLGKAVFVLAGERTPVTEALLALGAYPLPRPGDIAAGLRYI